MKQQRRNALKLLSGLGAIATHPALSRAQSRGYPSSPVTVVVPYGAGGSTDILARLLVEDVAKHMSGSFVVQNKPGAAGNIGAQMVAGARPDGTTLLYSTATPFAINPFVYRTLPFDPENDFVAIARTAMLPLVLVVTAGLDVKTLPAFINHLKANKASCSFSSYGVGTSSHIAGSIFVNKIGAPEVLHVPYKDMTAMADLSAGRNTFHIDAWSAVEPLVKTGKLRPLAVSSTEALPWAPDLPTIASVIKDDYEVVTWHAVFGPRQTPAGIVNLLNDEFQKSVERLEKKRIFTQHGFLTYPPASPAQIQAFVKEDRKRWQGYVKMAGITPS